MSWLAWIYMDHELTELTTEIIEDERCSSLEGPLGLRFDLLAVYLDIKNEKGDLEEFDEISIDEIYKEDLPLYRAERAVLSPHFRPPLSIRAVLMGGYTTNAMFGSANDPAMTHKKMDSPLLAHQLHIGYAPLATPWLSPRFELTSNSSIYLFEDESRSPKEERAGSADPLDFTSFDFGARAGLTFLRPHVLFPSLFVGYRGDVLFLNMEDQYNYDPPLVFYEGHRGEFELALLPEVVLFGGGGRRFFREDIRTRWEIDGGVGVHKGLTSWLSVLGAASARRHWAEDKAYDLFGASVLVQLVFGIWRGIQLKSMLALHLDHYGSSRGFFHADLTRRDTTVKATAELLTMSLKGVRFSAAYEFSDRFSSVPSYAFLDHRVLAKVTLYFGFDLLGSKASKDEHIALDYGLEVTATGEAEGIQELLRTDEHVRGGPGCGCVE
jgi:hypothetical protein